MKKILGAVLAGTLIAGMAFADPAITLNYRTRMNAYEQTKSDLTTENGVWDQDGYGLSQDCFVVDISTDYAGVHMDVDPTNPVTLGNNPSNSTNFYFNDDGGYYGWMKFFKMLTVTAGNFDQRNVDRVNWASTEISLTDQDEAKLGIWKGLVDTNSTITALGTATKTTACTGISTIGFDAGDFASGELAAAVQFDKDALMLRGAIVQTDTAYDTDTGDTTTTTYSGYQLEGAYNIDKVGKLDVMFKAPAKDQTVFGVYFMPTMVEKLEATVGFTYANQGNDDYNKYTGFAIDARAGYQISDALKAVIQANYSSVTPDKKGQFTSGKDAAETGFYVIGGVAYTASDIFTLKCDAGLYFADLDDNDSSDGGENYFKLAPSVKMSAGKGAAVTAGVVYKQHLNTGDTDNTYLEKSAFAIPVIVRVQL